MSAFFQSLPLFNVQTYNRERWSTSTSIYIIFVACVAKQQVT